MTRATRSGRCSTTPAGLFEKSRVVTAGISIGQIEKRELDQDHGEGQDHDPHRARHRAVRKRDRGEEVGVAARRIFPGDRSRHAAQVVDGQVKEMRRLKDGDQIKVVTEPVELGEMMASMGTLIPVMRQILDDVHKLTSGPISDIANNVDEMIEKNSGSWSRCSTASTTSRATSTASRPRRRRTSRSRSRTSARSPNRSRRWSARRTSRSRRPAKGRAARSTSCRGRSTTSTSR